MKWTIKQPSVLPGFNLTLGFTIFYLSLIVLIPLSALFLKAAVLGVSAFWHKATEARVLASYWLSFRVALWGAMLNAIFGLVVAWVLVRYQFPGKKIMDALVDLPFALPTAVSGIVLTTLYAPNGILGKPLQHLGIKVAYTPLGIIVATTFISLPFVVRTLQPAIADLESEMEEAASSLGADRFQTFWRIILPTILPALFTGFALAFARALGEYGSVVFIAGNMPMKTEIVPLLIMTKLEQFDYTGATVIAIVTLVASFALLLLINILQWWNRRFA